MKRAGSPVRSSSHWSEPSQQLTFTNHSARTLQILTTPGGGQRVLDYRWTRFLNSMGCCCFLSQIRKNWIRSWMFNVWNGTCATPTWFWWYLVGQWPSRAVMTLFHIAGEWLKQCHGVNYCLPSAPSVPAHSASFCFPSFTTFSFPSSTLAPRVDHGRNPPEPNSGVWVSGHRWWRGRKVVQEAQGQLLSLSVWCSKTTRWHELNANNKHPPPPRNVYL